MLATFEVRYVSGPPRPLRIRLKRPSLFRNSGYRSYAIQERWWVAFTHAYTLNATTVHVRTSHCSTLTT